MVECGYDFVGSCLVFGYVDVDWFLYVMCGYWGVDFGGIFLICKFVFKFCCGEWMFEWCD